MRALALPVSCFLSVFVASLAVGCAGAPTPAAGDPSAESMPSADETTSEPAEKASTPETTETDKPTEEEAPPPKKPAIPTPEFKPGMSVNEATSAVPDGIPRLNMEQEVLSAPLQNPDLYAPCKPRAAQRFKLRLAVWNGKVVGLDLSVSPKNAAFESCLREQLTKLEWKDRVESLNTIEYAL